MEEVSKWQYLEREFPSSVGIRDGALTGSWLCLAWSSAPSAANPFFLTEPARPAVIMLGGRFWKLRKRIEKTAPSGYGEEPAQVRKNKENGEGVTSPFFLSHFKICILKLFHKITV